MVPNRQKYNAVTARLAAVNLGLRNRRRSSIGERRRNSTTCEQCQHEDRSDERADDRRRWSTRGSGPR